MESDLRWVHRQAGMAIQFEWQDRGKWGPILEYTTILGEITLIEAWIVRCDGTATDGAAQGEYWWPVTEYLVVYKNADGEPTSRHATDEEVEMFESK